MQSRPGSFSAYLEYAQRDAAAPSQSSPTGNAALLKLLAKSSTTEVPMSILADLSAMTASEFRDAIAKLVKSNFIAVSGEPLSEMVMLTDKGRDAAALF